MFKKVFFFLKWQYLNQYYKTNSDNMSKKDRVQMPQSTAGLVRYFEESKEAIKLKPEHVVVVCVLIIALEIAFKFMFV
jgi:preprotein translocase subunit Sec61beta